MWPELYINSKLVSLAPSVRHHHRHDYHHDEPAPPASAQHSTRNHLHVQRGRTTPLSPGHPLPPLPPPLSALQPGGRRKLLEFSKSDVQDIMNEGMASSRRWRRWWSSNWGRVRGRAAREGWRDAQGWLARWSGGTQAKLPASAHSSASRATHQPIRLA